jgi:DNA mismatch repair protein MutS
VIPGEGTPAGGASSQRLTPVHAQYQAIKRRYPDCILLFRLGDFYEMFHEDAVRAAPLLGITLTSRELGKGQRYPMAGFPYHARDAYIAKLLQAGGKVAICDQAETTAGGKGLVRRTVTRVVTPGTLLEAGYLHDHRPNEVAALWAAAPGSPFGLAVLEVSTGEFRVTQFAGSAPQAAEELHRLQPAECLAPARWRDDPAYAFLTAYAPVYLPDGAFQPHDAAPALRRALEVESLAGFGCADLPEACTAAAALLEYVRANQLAVLPATLRLRTYHLGDFMHLDPATVRNLELIRPVGEGSGPSLLSILDQTRTPPGARLLRQWVTQPLLEAGAIATRSARVKELWARTPQRDRLREHLRQVGDLGRLCNRLVQGVGNARDALALKQALAALPRVRAALQAVEQPGCAALAALILTHDDLHGHLESALMPEPPASVREGGMIRPGFDEELDALIEGVRGAREWISGLEASERARTGIRTLKVGYNQVFGYFLDVSRAQQGAVPPEYIRKQTLVNAERFITPELKDQEALVLQAQASIAARESTLFQGLCERILQEAAGLLATAAAVAETDVLASLACVAAEEGWSQPRLTDGGPLDIRAGRHPLVERGRGAGTFVPNDCFLDETGGPQILLLTGPNMAGKSTYLRQVAVIVLLAQIGSFVPATGAGIGLVDRIFTRVGAHDDLSRGLSTFMVEMVETAAILHHATRRSLIILDEVGRGTSTYDGISIAQALLEYLHDAPHLGAKTIFATHFHELTALAGRLPRLRNFRVEVLEREGKVAFLYRIVAGGADRSYGLHVAQLAGVPAQVVTRARQILGTLEGQRPLEGAPAASEQLGLPLPADHPVVQALEQLDLEQLTPREALDLLFDWKTRAQPGMVPDG